MPCNQQSLRSPSHLFSLSHFLPPFPSPPPPTPHCSNDHIVQATLLGTAVLGPPNRRGKMIPKKNGNARNVIFHKFWTSRPLGIRHLTVSTSPKDFITGGEGGTVGGGGWNGSNIIFDEYGLGTPIAEVWLWCDVNNLGMPPSWWLADTKQIPERERDNILHGDIATVPSAQMDRCNTSSWPNFRDYFSRISLISACITQFSASRNRVWCLHFNVFISFESKAFNHEANEWDIRLMPSFLHSYTRAEQCKLCL